MSPIRNIETKDLNSIKAVTSRAFDLLSAQSNRSKFGNCDWVIEPKDLAIFVAFETQKEKMNDIFDIGYQAAKNSFKAFKNLDLKLK